MPYGRIGAELGSDRLSVTFGFNNPLEADNNPLATNEERQWVYRFLFGVGVELPLVPACGTTFRVEYDFHSKGRTLIATTAINDGIFNPSFQAESQPFTQSGTISVVWNFF